MSAGASSSLFGLLGAGFLLERTIGTHIKKLTGIRPRNRAYMMTVLINLGLGLMIPFIDNSAHIGGLLAGFLITYAMINIRPNNLRPRNFTLGFIALTALGLIGGVGIYLSASTSLVLSRIAAAGDRADDPEEKIFRYSQALLLNPEEADVRLKRARIFFAEGSDNYAFNDIRVVIAKGASDLQILKFADEMDHQGKVSTAWEIRQMLSHSHENQ